MTPGVGFSRRVVLGAAALATIGACARRDASSALKTPAEETLDDDAPFSIEAIKADLLALDAVEHLRSGDAGERAISARTAGRLAALGYDVAEQLFEVPYFTAKTSALRWEGGEAEVFAQHIVTPTGPAGVEAPLRLWRLGDDPARLAGAIALVLLPYARHSQLIAKPSRESLDAALAGKPAAVVLITNGPTGETIMLNAPYAAPYAPVPIAVLGPKPGAAAIEAARLSVAGRLILDGESGRRPSHNLIARRTGPGKSLVVSTPRTAWTPAVAERGPGFAAFLAIAAWATGALPGRDLIFVQTTAHEYDNAGGLHFLESDLAPKPEDVFLWLHLGAGFAGRAHHEFGEFAVNPLSSVDAQRFLIGSDDLIPLLAREFAGQPGLENPYPESRGAVGELAEVFAKGYKPAFGMLAAHLRHHLMSDRIAMTDPEWVRMAAIAARNVIRARAEAFR